MYNTILTSIGLNQSVRRSNFELTNHKKCIVYTCTLPPAYLSCEFAFHVRFQRIVRALSLNCEETRINVFRNS